MRPALGSGLSRRQALVGSLALLAQAGLAGGPAYAQARTPLLRYGLSAWPPNLQPWVTTGASAGTVKMLIHGRLIAYDKDGKLRRRAGRKLRARRATAPGCSGSSRTRPSTTAIRSPRPTSSTSIEQIAGEKSTAYMRGQFQNIARIETPDPRTIRLVTKQPVATLPSWFANYNMPILSAKSTATEFIGCGAYRLDAQERGTSIELVANDKYFKPGLPRIAAHPLRRLCGREPARRGAAVRRRGHDRIRAVAVDGGGRARSAAQDGHAVRAVHGRAVQRHQGTVLRRARAPRGRACGPARGHRAGRLLRPRQGRWKACRSSKARRGGTRSCRAAGATTSRRPKRLLAAAGVPNGFQTTHARRPRSSACTRTRPRSCSSISPPSASSAS